MLRECSSNMSSIPHRPALCVHTSLFSWSPEVDTISRAQRIATVARNLMTHSYAHALAQDRDVSGIEKSHASDTQHTFHNHLLICLVAVALAGLRHDDAQVLVMLTRKWRLGGARKRCVDSSIRKSGEGSDLSSYGHPVCDSQVGTEVFEQTARTELCDEDNTLHAAGNALERFTRLVGMWKRSRLCYHVVVFVENHCWMVLDDQNYRTLRCFSNLWCGDLCMLCFVVILT